MRRNFVKKAISITRESSRSGRTVALRSSVSRPRLSEIPDAGSEKEMDVPVISPPSAHASNPMSGGESKSAFVEPETPRDGQSDLGGTPLRESSSSGFSNDSGSESDNEIEVKPKSTELTKNKVITSRSAQYQSQETPYTSVLDSTEYSANTLHFKGYSSKQLDAVSKLCEVIRQDDIHVLKKFPASIRGVVTAGVPPLPNGKGGASKHHAPDKWDSWIEGEKNGALNEIIKLCCPLIQDNLEIISKLSRRIFAVEYLGSLIGKGEDPNEIVDLTWAIPRIWEEKTNLEVIKILSNHQHRDFLFGQLDKLKNPHIERLHHAVLDIFTSYDRYPYQSLMLYVSSTTKQDSQNIGIAVSKLADQGHLGHTQQLLKFITFLSKEKVDCSKVSFETLKYLAQNCPDIFANRSEILKHMVPRNKHQNIDDFFSLMKKRNLEGLNGELVSQLDAWNNSTNTMSVQEKTRIFFKMSDWKMSATRKNSFVIKANDESKQCVKGIMRLIHDASKNPSLMPELDTIPYQMLMTEFVARRKDLYIHHFTDSNDKSKASLEFLLNTFENIFSLAIIDSAVNDPLIKNHPELSLIDWSNAQSTAMENLQETLTTRFAYDTEMLEQENLISWLRQCFAVLHQNSREHRTEDILLNYTLDQIMSVQPMTKMLSDKANAVFMEFQENRGTLSEDIQAENSALLGIAKNLLREWKPSLPNTADGIKAIAGILTTGMVYYLDIDLNFLSEESLKALVDQLFGIITEGRKNGLSDAEILQLLKAKLQTIISIAKEKVVPDVLRSASEIAPEAPHIPTDRLAESLPVGTKIPINPTGGESVVDAIKKALLTSGESKAGH